MLGNVNDERVLFVCFFLLQTATLEVVVPPDILNDQGAAEVLVPEGGVARLSCKAHGHPAPRVTWRREDGQDIVIRNGPSQKLKGNILHFDLTSFFL